MTICTQKEALKTHNHRCRRCQHRTKTTATEFGEAWCTQCKHERNYLSLLRAHPSVSYALTHHPSNMCHPAFFIGSVRGSVIFYWRFFLGGGVLSKRFWYEKWFISRASLLFGLSFPIATGTLCLLWLVLL